MKQSVLNEAIDARDCVALITLPTSFRAFCVSYIRSGYAKIQGWRWFSYRAEFLNGIYSDFRRAARLRSVEVVEDACLSDLRSSLERKRLVVIIGHYESSGPVRGFEFCDGFCDAQLLSQQIPKSFNGILDFCGCEPWGLIQKIKAAAPDCITITTPMELNPIDQIELQGLILEFISNGCTYAEAMRRVNGITVGITVPDY